MDKIIPSDLKGFNDVFFTAFISDSAPTRVYAGYYKTKNTKGLERWTSGFEKPLITPGEVCKKINILIDKGFKHNQEMHINFKLTKMYPMGMDTVKSKTIMFKNGMFKVI